MYEAVRSILNDAVINLCKDYFIAKEKAEVPEAELAFITAGTSDMPVAERLALQQSSSETRS